MEILELHPLNIEITTENIGIVCLEQICLIPVPRRRLHCAAKSFKSATHINILLEVFFHILNCY